MVMEGLDSSVAKEKIKWDIIGHSGDNRYIPLSLGENPPSNDKDRYKVLQQTASYPQFCFPGDYTIEATRECIRRLAAEEEADEQQDVGKEALVGVLRRHNHTADEQELHGKWQTVRYSSVGPAAHCGPPKDSTIACLYRLVPHAPSIPHTSQEVTGYDEAECNVEDIHDHVGVVCGRLELQYVEKDIADLG